MSGSKYNIENVISIVNKYKSSFISKTFKDINLDVDILMELFEITPESKIINMQYWNRELGMIWELITKELMKVNPTFKEAEPTEFGNDRPVDYYLGSIAIDTKYRIGSGDSGTLKKFKQYGKLLMSKGYEPVFLVLRDDNLPAAIAAALAGGWKIYTYKNTFDFILSHTGYDIVKELAFIKTKYFK